MIPMNNNFIAWCKSPLWCKSLHVTVRRFRHQSQFPYCYSIQLQLLQYIFAVQGGSQRLLMTTKVYCLQ